MHRFPKMLSRLRDPALRLKRTASVIENWNRAKPSYQCTGLPVFFIAVLSVLFLGSSGLF